MERTVDPYILRHKLGEGAVTEVWEAMDPSLDRPAAIKLLRGDHADLEERFRGETKRCFRLRHSHIVNLFNFVVKDGHGYLVMELVEGETLAARIGRPGGVFHLEEILQISRDVLSALDYAHGEGLLHRGIKPSNILLDRKGRVVLSDFGIGYGIQSEFGPADFRSPEQVRNEANLDLRSDIYSFGCVLWAMLAKAPPSPAVAEIARRCMNPERDGRYANCREVIAALEMSSHAAAFAAEELSEAPSPVDEDVQFTVYRPQAVQPESWKMLLAFAHRSSRPADARPDEPDPLQEVQRQAEEILGQDIREYRNLSQDATRGIPRQGMLTLIPEMEGAAFQPASQSLQWTGKVPPAVFLFRVRREFLGKTVRGSLFVYLGSIIVAQVPLSVRVDAAPAAAGEPYALQGARWYRRIFASYSHRDSPIVEEFERHAIAFGDDYLRDVTTLRTGSAWNEELRQMIRQADVFQLFWSDNAMNSPYVHQEYTYALGLQRPGFIRPVYWQDPMPEAPERGLPPRELQEIHFHRIAVGAGRSRAPFEEESEPTILAANTAPLPEYRREPLRLPESAGSAPPMPASGGPKVMRMGVVVALVLILMGVVAFWLWGR